MSNARAHIKVAARPQNTLRENRKQGPGQGQGQDGGWKWVKPKKQDAGPGKTMKRCKFGYR